MQITIYTDSKSLYDALTGNQTPTEKRLLIDLTMLRQVYELRKITGIVWILPTDNPADAMTKERPATALNVLMRTNTLTISPKSWVERKNAQFAKGEGDDNPKKSKDFKEGLVSS